MKTKKKALAAIAVAASVTLVLSACGGSSSDGNKAKTSSGGYNAAVSAVVNPSTKTGLATRLPRSKVVHFSQSPGDG